LISAYKTVKIAESGDKAPSLSSTRIVPVPALEGTSTKI